jgi:hypothetical protein
MYKITWVKRIFILKVYHPQKCWQYGLSIFLSITVSSPRLYICLRNRSPTIVLIGMEGLPPSPDNPSQSFSR